MRDIHQNNNDVFDPFTYLDMDEKEQLMREERIMVTTTHFSSFEAEMAFRGSRQRFGVLNESNEFNEGMYGGYIILPDADYYDSAHKFRVAEQIAEERGFNEVVDGLLINSEEVDFAWDIEYEGGDTYSDEYKEETNDAFPFDLYSVIDARKN